MLALLFSAFLKPKLIIDKSKIYYKETLLNASLFDRTFDRRDREYFSGQANSPVVIGNIVYKHSNGQIGLIYVDYPFRRQGLSGIMLNDIEQELKLHNVSVMWAACSKDHYFWSKLKKFKYQDQVHHSVTSGGYIYPIN